MGLVTPSLPDLDLDAWRAKPRMERVRPMVQHWALHGFGSPEAVYALYLLKIGAYVLGAAWVASRTPGLGGLGDLSAWWTEPIVFQKVVVFTLLFEVLGLGCGFGPLTLRFLPPVGGPLYWLRPGTIRLPPWPEHVPGTRGDARTVIDVGLYAGVLASAVWLLDAPGTEPAAAIGATVGLIDPARLVPLVLCLGLIGLRDKTVFLAARSEVYLFLALAFSFGATDWLVASKLGMLVIWWGAAVSKLNRHFPNVIEGMESNNPLLRFAAFKRRLHIDPVDDVRPSHLATALAHVGTAIELSVPLVLLLSDGGWPTTAAAIVMIAFHLHILSALPLGAPFEWNVFMAYGVAYLFVHHADVGLGDLVHPLPVAGLIGAQVVLVVLGNLYPSRFSFLISMRYYAGNWATSMWCMTPAAMAKLDGAVTGFSGFGAAQLVRLYGQDVADVLAHKVYAFRALHTHGRALFGLIERAAGPDHETTHVAIDGELVAGPMLGWNFGEGHLHNEQLLAALQRRCAFEPGEVRVIMLEAQPMGASHQEYRIVDGATGEIERGRVQVADLLTRQPWAGEIPVEVTSVAPG